MKTLKITIENPGFEKNDFSSNKIFIRSKK